MHITWRLPGRSRSGPGLSGAGHGCRKGSLPGRASHHTSLASSSFSMYQPETNAHVA